MEEELKEISEKQKNSNNHTNQAEKNLINFL